MKNFQLTPKSLGRGVFMIILLTFFMAGVVGCSKSESAGGGVSPTPTPTPTATVGIAAPGVAVAGKATTVYFTDVKNLTSSSLVLPNGSTVTGSTTGITIPPQTVVETKTVECSLTLNNGSVSTTQKLGLKVLSDGHSKLALDANNIPYRYKEISNTKQKVTSGGDSLGTIIPIGTSCNSFVFGTDNKQYVTLQGLCSPGSGATINGDYTISNNDNTFTLTETNVFTILQVGGGVFEIAQIVLQPDGSYLRYVKKYVAF